MFKKLNIEKSKNTLIIATLSSIGILITATILSFLNSPNWIGILLGASSLIYISSFSIWMYLVVKKVQKYDKITLFGLEPLGWYYIFISLFIFGILFRFIPSLSWVGGIFSILSLFAFIIVAERMYSITETNKNNLWIIIGTWTLAIGFSFVLTFNSWSWVVISIISIFLYLIILVEVEKISSAKKVIN